MARTRKSKDRAVLALLTAVASACLAPEETLAPPGGSQVVGVVVAPTSALLQPGDSLQFRAYGVAADGSRVIIPVRWSASGGRITSEGVFIADTLPGTFTVSANGAGQTGAATVIVTKPAPRGTWPNEPSGLTLISDYGFDAVIPATYDPLQLGTSGWRVRWNPVGDGSRIVDPAELFSPPGVYQVRYPVGFGEGSSPSTLEYDFASRPTELYWCFWWKPSNPFQSHSSGVNKIAFIWTPSGSTDLLYFDLSPNPWRIRCMNDLIAGGGPDAGKRDEPNVTTTVITLGQWHRIEIHAKYSTGSNADGTVRWWVDGVLNGNYTNLKMLQDGGFDHIQFGVTFGGAGTGETKTETDYYWFDHVRVSGR